MSNEKDKLAVLLLNLGGPENPAQIQPYLFELFSDPEIIQLPLKRLLQKTFARFLAKIRTEKIKVRYRAIGGGSRIISETRKQAERLSRILSLPVEWAMRYGQPNISTVVKKLESLGVQRLILIPLFPQYSRAITGSIISAFKAQNKSLSYVIIPHHYSHPGYLNALVDSLKTALRKIDPALKTHLLFTAHSLPERYLKKGEPYVEQIEQTVRLLCPTPVIWVPETQSRISYSLAYQSKLGPIKWHGPNLEQELKKILKNRIQQLIVFPISFVAENLETLFDLDLEFKAKALQGGIKNFLRVPCLGDSEIYLNALAELVREALKNDQWEKPNA